MWYIFLALGWSWERGLRLVCFGSGGVGGPISAAAPVTALDGDWFGHVHTEQGAEGHRLGRAHARDGSRLDTISTGY